MDQTQYQIQLNSLHFIQLLSFHTFEFLEETLSFVKTVGVNQIDTSIGFMREGFLRRAIDMWIIRRDIKKEHQERYLIIMKELFDILIKSGSKSIINIPDSYDGNTVLNFAIKNHLTWAIALLLSEKSVNINIPNSDGHTPLMLAILTGNLKAIYLLFSRLKEMNWISDTTNKDGKTAKQMLNEIKSTDNISDSLISQMKMSFDFVEEAFPKLLLNELKTTMRLPKELCSMIYQYLFV